MDYEEKRLTQCRHGLLKRLAFHRSVLSELEGRPRQGRQYCLARIEEDGSYGSHFAQQRKDGSYKVCATYTPDMYPSTGIKARIKALREQYAAHSFKAVREDIWHQKQVQFFEWILGIEAGEAI